MAVMRITDTEMTSDTTAHTAHPVDPGKPYGEWLVSWLPGKPLDRNSAITAIILAEHVAEGHNRPGTKYWPFVRGWAEELHLDVQDAVSRVSQQPEG